MKIHTYHPLGSNGHGRLCEEKPLKEEIKKSNKKMEKTCYPLMLNRGTTFGFGRWLARKGKRFMILSHSTFYCGTLRVPFYLCSFMDAHICFLCIWFVGLAGAKFL